MANRLLHSKPPTPPPYQPLPPETPAKEKRFADEPEGAMCETLKLRVAGLAAAMHEGGLISHVGKPPHRAMRMHGFNGAEGERCGETNMGTRLAAREKGYERASLGVCLA